MKYKVIIISTPFDDEQNTVGAVINGDITIYDNINNAYAAAQRWNDSGPRKCEVVEVENE